MITPFVNLNGRCEEAIEFYEKVFGGSDKRIMRYKDAPHNPDFPVADEDKELVMHAEMTIKGVKFNFGDVPHDIVPGNLLSLAVQFETAAEVIDAYEQLKDGGMVLMEAAPQFYSPMYAWVADKFGIGWQLLCR